MSFVSKPRRLAPVAAPVGIACLGVAMVLCGLGSVSGLTRLSVGLMVTAGPLVVVGLWLLAGDWAWNQEGER